MHEKSAHFAARCRAFLFQVSAGPEHCRRWQVVALIFSYQTLHGFQYFQQSVTDISSAVGVYHEAKLS